MSTTKDVVDGTAAAFVIVPTMVPVAEAGSDVSCSVNEPTKLTLSPEKTDTNTFWVALMAPLENMPDVVCGTNLLINLVAGKVVSSEQLTPVMAILPASRAALRLLLSGRMEIASVGHGLPGKPVSDNWLTILATFPLETIVEPFLMVYAPYTFTSDWSVVIVKMLPEGKTAL